ncbi:MAG: hypothetical protein DIU71_11520 [Proteobacteria bacterium]|nr:MAG: hypothetical protein DIU71_11520 [Pseudomonadota bacterium]
MPALAVWMNGQRVGTWTRGRGDVSEFEYAQSWIQSEHFRVISLSIPVTADRKVRGPEVTYYFDNLLPRNPTVRKRISAGQQELECAPDQPSRFSTRAEATRASNSGSAASK